MRADDGMATPMELGTAWTSARAEGDLAWSLVLQDWTTDVLTGSASFTSDARVWNPDGGPLATSAWNLVALFSTGWLGIGAAPLLAWHRSMFFIGVLNGLGGAWLGHRVSGRPGAVIGAVACACAPLAWFELCEGRLEQGLIAPLAVWIAEASALSRSPRPVLAGAALALVAATYWFLGPIALIVAAPLPLLDPMRRLAPLREQPGRVGLGLAVCAGILVLALLPVAGAAWSGAQNAAMTDPVLGQTQRLASAVSPLAQVFGGDLPAHRIPAVALIWLPFAWWKPSLRPWLAALAVAAVLAAGSVLSVNRTAVLVSGYELSLPLRMLDVLPGFQRFWWPDRIVAVVGVVAAGGLATAISMLPATRLWWGVAIASLLLALDGRLQLRHAITTGDPRTPSTVLDPPTQGGFFAAPSVPTSQSPHPAIIGPWSTTANTIPLVRLATGRPLLRGDGAADPRLWPSTFTDRVSRDPLLQALQTGSDLPSDIPDRLDQLSVDTVLWLGPERREDWTRVLGCSPTIVGSWATWDRSREECR